MGLRHGIRLRQRWRRAAFMARVRFTARRAGGHVELDLAPDLQVLGRGVTVTVMPGTSSVLRIGPGSRIEDGVTLMLKGGRLEAGPRMELRRGVIVSLAGVLRMESDNAISWGSIIHCSNDILLEPMAGIAEYATVADSSHYFTDPEEHFWHNVRKGSVRIGRNTWICPKVTLTRNSDVGSHCIVGAGSVVVGTVPDGHLASGVPAVCRPLDLPWQQG
ncbi:MAG: acyltransferase [Actinomycetota bacterium]|nr:acyltransferase [Actinomycetota bacterium]